MSLKGLNLNAFKKAPIPAPRVIEPGSKEFETIVREETHNADAVLAVTDAILDSTPGGAKVVDATESNISSEEEKLNRLVDDDFPFDETQLAAVHGLVQEQYGCLIGAAGTGKTTVSKKFVDLLRDGLDEIDMSQYWKRGVSDEHDDYETPEKLIPAIALVSFTGRASQMTKKNFPREWHGNIMTIHRALGFYPEYYQDLDPESGEMVNKRRFVPAYTAENKMPWKIIVIDETGMLGLELWHQLLAACTDDCRIYMIGDINQLPPTHGKSILGFALNEWPVFELTHVHRQQGANNSIVDNAHRILKGLRPVSDSPTPLSIKDPKSMQAALNFMVKDDSWRFLTIEIDDEHQKAAARIAMVLKLLHGRIYEPNRDVLITPINGFEQTAPGYTLGQAPLNQRLVTLLNQDAPRYIIDAGRERMNFAVGDKVMATVNDYEAGITNGMTGIITSIEENGGYIGDVRRFGLISEVNAYYDSIETDEDEDADFNLEDMVQDSQAGLDELKKREKRDAGPASHIVTVVFGEGEHAFEIAFDSKSKVASLMLAYAATCHKMQGGEAPLVFGIVHSSNKRPLNREWAYTMVTRASNRCVMFHNRQGVGFAIGKQTIKGVNLKAKIASFAALTADTGVGPTVRVKLPKARSLVTDLVIHNKEQVNEENTQLAEAARRPEFAGYEETTQEPKVVFRDRVIVVEVERAEPQATCEESFKDGGELRGTSSGEREDNRAIGSTSGTRALPAPPQYVSQIGAVRMAVELGHAQTFAQRLLTHQPAPKVNPLAALLAKQGVKKP